MDGYENAGNELDTKSLNLLKKLERKTSNIKLDKKISQPGTRRKEEKINNE